MYIINISGKSYHEVLGASYPEGGEQITLFIPSKDRLGKSINQAQWVDQALSCFGLLFRGATAFPPGKGIWRNDENNGELLYETTVMVITYVNLLDLEKNLNELRRFLHRFGREANQGEIGIIISGTYYGISVYDS